MSQRPSFPIKLAQTGAAGPSGKAPVKAPAKAPAALAARSGPGTLAATAVPRSTSPVAGLGLDSGAVRARMDRKLAEQGVQDARVLDAMGQVERHRFVESALVNQAYEGTSLPIGLGQTISKPKPETGEAVRGAALPTA